MKRVLLLATVVLQLVACAGGGGGGGGANTPGASAPPTQGTGPSPTPTTTPASTPTTTPASTPTTTPASTSSSTTTSSSLTTTTPTTTTTYVPYATPVRAGSITPINSNAYEYDSSALYAENLTNNGQSLITAGRSGTTNGGSYPTYNLNVFDWENGQLVNKTSRWFTGRDNVILGTEPSVKFGDFNGDGKRDMYVSPNTDNSGTAGSGWLFLNSGSSFSRVDLGLNINGHDSAVYDINRDGVDDIFTTGSRVTFGSRTNNFTTHTVSGRDYGGTAGSVAIADFMGNGTSTVILTDQNSFRSGGTNLYSWAMTNGGRPTLDFELTKISTLPESRFFLPKWASNGFSGSHDYRSLAFDFDNSGLTSAVIFSRPVMANGTWPDFSEIQFLKNRGGGTFIDVTDTTLVGYDTKTSANYNPKLADINSDGLTDIVLASTGWGSTTGAQVLIHTKEHKYVASYAAVIDAFVGQSTNLERAINASAQGGANGIVFVKGPDDSMYLATAISYSNNGVQQKAIYLSKLGATTTTTTQATITSIKQIWPWMNDAQVNTVLAASSTNYFGFNLLDTTKVFQPVGDMSVPLAGKGFAPIRGYVMGLGLDDSDTLVTDSVGRGFTTNLKFMNVNGLNSFGYNTEHIDQYNLTSHAEYLVNGSPMTYGNMRIATENRNAFFGNDQGPGLLQKPTQYSVGIPEIYKNGKFTFGAQFTNLNTNPWIAIGGAWGSITNSGILDNVATYRDGGFSAQASLMHVTTNITPGLITKVNNIVGGWAESGYRYTDDRFGDIGVYAGVKPVVLSGNVEAKMPTSVDNAGNVVYTNKKLAIQNQVTPYVRALYTNMIDKKTMYRFSVMGTQQGQYRLMHELRFWID
jgi:hypothetical protein